MKYLDAHTIQEMAREERLQLNRLFPAKRTDHPKKGGLDKISLIQKYQQVHARERYPLGYPKNMLRPEELVKILK